jgi:hypothetical protein
MTVFAQMMFPASLAESDVDLVKTLTLFCGAGLSLSLLLISYGLDLGTALF